MTIMEVEERLREISPICNNYIWNGQEYCNNIKLINDLDNSEMNEHIDFLKQYAAENLYLIIDDPKY